MTDVYYDEVIVEEEEPGICDVLKEEARELKWAVLAVACFLTFGSYYIYDFPGSIGSGAGNTIEENFRRHSKRYTQGMNQVLYSVYSWPNTILAMFGGLLIDRYLGLRRAMLLFTVLILLGSVLFAAGVRFTTYSLMVAGRVIFGLGGESLSVAQSAYVARWFKGSRGMALAFGITISFSRVGSSFNFLLSPMIARNYDVNIAVTVGVAACLVSLVACVVLIAADMYAVRIGYIKPEAYDMEEGVMAEEPMKFSDVLRLPVVFWLLCAICVFCYTAIFPFIGIGKNFFEVKYGYSGSTASTYMSSYQFTSAAASPAIGLLVDAVGRNTWWLIAASACFVLIHVCFMTTMIPGVVLMVAMGCFYSFLVSGLWPAIPWAVQGNVVGFAYGVMTAIQNIGLAVAPIVVGLILDHHTPSAAVDGSLATQSFLYRASATEMFDSESSASDEGRSASSFPGGEGPLPTLQGYYWTELLFVGAAAVSLLASVALLITDLRADGILSVSNAERLAFFEQQVEQGALLDGTIPENQRTLLQSSPDAEGPH